MSDNVKEETKDSEGGLELTQGKPGGETAQAESQKDEESPASLSSFIPPEVLKDMPPQVRASFEQFSLQMRSGPPVDPIREKITTAHISDIVTQTGEDHRRDFELVKHGRWMLVVVLAIILTFLLLLYWLFKDNPQAIQPILTHLFAFAGGIGGGMAIRSRRAS